MTDEQKPKPEKQVESLELNRETIQDLTEQEAEQAAGGVVGNTGVCARCTGRESGCN
jgi:hypothetical protein